MQLKFIYELKLSKAIAKVGPLLQVLPKGKQKHSKRVAKSLNKAKVNKIGVYAGLLHDYLERGGDLYTLTQHIDELGLPPQIVAVVRSLSQDENAEEGTDINQPLSHLQAVLQQIGDEEIKNIIILAKLSDRLDNLHKRLRRGKLGKKYVAKSKDLIQWLSDQYTGKPKSFRKILNLYREVGIV